MIGVSVQIDMTQINAAIAVAQRFTTRKGRNGLSVPQEVLRETAWQVTKRTIELTELRSTTIARIDTELGTAVALQPKTRGKGFRTAKRSQRYVSGNMIPISRRLGQPVKTQMVPMAALIVHAQVVTDAPKNYNLRTNFRYKRFQSPFRGKTRAAGAAAMRAAVHRLIAARHSSTKFLVAGWYAVRSQLSMRARKGPPMDGGGSSSAPLKQFKHFGEIRWLGNGNSLEIANLIGTEAGSRGDNSANINRALHQYSGPCLQQALGEVSVDMMAHYHDRLVAEDLAPEWNRAR